jgi:hypothetical protein
MAKKVNFKGLERGCQPIALSPGPGHDLLAYLGDINLDTKTSCRASSTESLDRDVSILDSRLVYVPIYRVIPRVVWTLSVAGLCTRSRLGSIY